MTILEQLRLLVNLTFCACIALCVLWASRRPLGRKHARTSDLPFFLTCWFIPLYWLFLLLDTFSQAPRDLLPDAAFSLCVQFAGLLSLYYLLLLLLLPLLRRWVLPQTCALLWLLPVCLYFLRHSVKAAPRLVLDYLAGLEARKITGGYTFAHVSPRLELCYDGPDFSRTVILAGDYLICRPRSNTSAQQEVYLVSGGVDWDLLTGLPEAAS